MGVSGSCYRWIFHRKFTVIGQCTLETIVLLTLLFVCHDRVLDVERKHP